MADGASVVAAISSVKTALDIAKLIRESGAALKTAELQLQLSNVISALVDARSDLIDTQDELRQRDARIADLRAALEDKATLVRVNDAYYRVGADGRHHGAAYCTRCWEADHLLRSLATLGMGHTKCPACQNIYDEARTGTFP